jgi:sucrose-6-phosphate hydrolase SacC (GH32 family)
MIQLGMPFSQLLSLPVELTLRTTEEGVRVFSNPASEITSIRAEHRVYPMKDLSTGSLLVNDIPWELYEVQVTFDFENANTIRVRIRGVEISYDVKTQILSLGNYKVKVKPQKGKLRLRALLDRCSVDLFANDGSAYLMDSAFPDNSKAALEYYAGGGQVTVKNIEFYRLNSIWKND